MLIPFALQYYLEQNTRFTTFSDGAFSARDRWIMRDLLFLGSTDISLEEVLAVGSNISQTHRYRGGWLLQSPSSIIFIPMEVSWNRATPATPKSIIHFRLGFSLKSTIHCRPMLRTPHVTKPPIYSSLSGWCEKASDCPSPWAVSKVRPWGLGLRYFKVRKHEETGTWCRAEKYQTSLNADFVLNAF